VSPAEGWGLPPSIGQGGILVGTPVVDGEDLARFSVENGDWQSSIEP